MRFVRKLIVLSLIITPVIIGSCKKQVRCGCDGDALRTLTSFQVKVYYDEETNYAEFRSIYDTYSTYYFCNPTDMMDKLSKFAQGAEVLIDCEIFWECNYVQQANNSYYGAMYKKYMAQVTDVREDLYGNK